MQVSPTLFIICFSLGNQSPPYLNSLAHNTIICLTVFVYVVSAIRSLHVVCRTRSPLWKWQSNANAHTICSVPHVVLPSKQHDQHRRPHDCAQAIVNLLFSFPSHTSLSFAFYTYIIHTNAHKVKRMMSRTCQETHACHMVVNKYVRNRTEYDLTR